MKKYLINAFNMLIILLLISPAYAQETPNLEKAANTEIKVEPDKQQPVKKNLELFCNDTFAETKECPQSQCRQICEGGLIYDGCKITCAAKECIELTVEECPEDVCQIIKGCSGKEICYYKLKKEPEGCGDVAYSGTLECCKGLQKRCGVEYFDSTCDMAPKASVYSAPICVNCGNGYCNQFENKCNCPEDCSE